VLQRLDAMAVGTAAWRLGAGRARKEDAVSPSAGVTWRATVGDRVTAGQPLVELHVDDRSRLPGALAALEGAFEIGPDPCAPPPLVLERVS
jgi:thymidine phosphorylase